MCGLKPKIMFRANFFSLAGIKPNNTKSIIFPTTPPRQVWIEIQEIHDCYCKLICLVSGLDKMHGAKRVIVFCCLTAILPTIILIIPLYLRHKIFMDTHIPVAESDILEVKEGISSIFCEVNLMSYPSLQSWYWFSFFSCRYMRTLYEDKPLNPKK